MNKIILFLLLITLGGCANFCERQKHDVRLKKDYVVRQYSGGKIIGEWKFNGIVTKPYGERGFCFSIQDTVIEITGDIQITFID